MKNIRPIRTPADLEWAMGEIEPYFAHPPALGSDDADRFDVLADLIDAYESRAFSIEPQEPVTFLKAFMEMTGRDQKELGAVLGSRSRASEVLNLKRALTVDMIFKLNAAWGIPANCLVRPYALVAA